MLENQNLKERDKKRKKKGKIMKVEFLILHKKINKWMRLGLLVIQV